MFNDETFQCEGITPIYMGSTEFGRHQVSVPGDHPHIHGEHNNFYFAFNNPKGSPPYTWGALVTTITNVDYERITPIYMGSTC